jgi:type I restriction enzyme S subunit
VDFDPVRAKAEVRPTGLPPEISDLFSDELVDSEIGEIPKGWEVVPLDQIGNFRNGLALQKYPPVNGEEQLPVIKIAQLRKGSTLGDDLFASGVPSDYVIDDGDYVFSWSGSLMAKYWVGGKGALNQHLFKVEEKTQPLWFIAGWVEHFMPEFQSIAESKVTTMGHIKREHLKQAMCVIPPGETIDQCGDAINPLKDRAIYSQLETRVLADLRDTLLPKLISGELRIPDAEKFLEEAGV